MVKGYMGIMKQDVIENGWTTYPYIIESSQTDIEFGETIESVLSAWFPQNKIIVEVEVLGEIVEKHGRWFSFTNKLKVIRKLTLHEVKKRMNEGHFNTGTGNTGNGNVGDRNVGYFNVGECNIGDYNTGRHNIGSYNTGVGNVGYCNGGISNIGNTNCGDFNKGNGCFGFFNTCKHGNKVYLFNQLTDLTLEDFIETKAYRVLHEMPMLPTKWIPLSEMTEEEKEIHPESKKINGFLKKVDLEKERQDWWDSLKHKKKNIILSMPNFNATIFKEVTGIDVGGAIEYKIVKNPNNKPDIFFHCGRIDSHTVLDACEKLCPRYSSCDTVAEMNDILRDYELNN